MKYSACLPLDEIYTHIDPDTGVVRHFNASAVQRGMDTLKASGEATQLSVALDPEFVRYVRVHRGVSMDKVARMVPPYLHIPVIGVKMHDGTVLTIDGHHRLVKLEAMGCTTYEMNLVEEGAWPLFLVEDMPNGLSNFLAYSTECEALTKKSSK